MKSLGRTETDSIWSRRPNFLRMRDEFGGICMPAPTCPPALAAMIFRGKLKVPLQVLKLVQVW